MNSWPKRHTKVSIFAGLIGLAATAHADWTVTNLHPAGATASRVLAIDGGEQVGHATFAGTTRAGIWYGTAASWMDLHPRGATTSKALGVHNGQQVGEVDGMAAMWSGTAASWASLHPEGASSSVARDVHDGVQVGEVDSEAVKWAGNVDSLTVLWSEIPGELNSGAYSIHNGEIVGWATFENPPFYPPAAIIWEGEFGSYMDFGVSFAYGNHNGQQVGRAGSWGMLAVLWHGPWSLVNLTPEGSWQAAARDVHSGWQVGWARFGGVEDGTDHASLWNGTAESWEDISLALHGSWGDTVAEDVWTDGQTLYVVGWGYNNDTDRIEALMWSRPLPGATSHVPGDYETIQAAIDAASDGDEVVIAPGTYIESINTNGKAITVRSTDPEDPEVVDATIIDGDGLFQVVTINSGEGPDTIINGLTIQNAFDRVVLLESSSPIVMNCTITGGTTFGGMGIEGGSPTISHCRIESNTAGCFMGLCGIPGGGLVVSDSDVTITHCSFKNNTATGSGGAIKIIGSTAIITHTTFDGNSGGDDLDGDGGAISIAGSNVEIHHCSFEGNSTFAGFGGAIDGGFGSDNVLIESTVFRGNTAGAGGGAIASQSGDGPSIGQSLFCESTPQDIYGNWNDLGGNEFLNDCPPECDLADLNCDGVVDGMDLLILLSSWGKCADPDDCPADLNEDGSVDGLDIVILLSNWS